MLSDRPESIGYFVWLRAKISLYGSVRRGLEITIVCATILVAAATVFLMSTPTNVVDPDSGQDYRFAALVRDASGDSGQLAPIGTTPAVEPVDYVQISAADARRANAAVPVVRGPNPAAAPFVFSGLPADRERALACLAAAAFYEAGDDVGGQSAVVQVVLNRVRHPAFPKSVCGVVLQGAERRTGCQFTFACDGSLYRRVPSAAEAARAIATAKWALSGGVLPLVGTATHYHTDYVLPIWGAQMDKVAVYHGHLFFRWRGGWGKPGAFRGAYLGGEQLDGRFARFDPGIADRAVTVPGSIDVNAASAVTAPSLPLTIEVAGRGAVATAGSVVRADDARHIYYVYFREGEDAGRYAVAAWNICAGKTPCKVSGWTKVDDVPGAVSAGESRGAIFSFEKSTDGKQQSRWDCQRVQRSNAAQCLPDTALHP